MSTRRVFQMSLVESRCSATSGSVVAAFSTLLSSPLDRLVTPETSARSVPIHIGVHPSRVQAEPSAEQPNNSESKLPAGDQSEVCITHPPILIGRVGPGDCSPG